MIRTAVAEFDRRFLGKRLRDIYYHVSDIAWHVRHYLQEGRQYARRIDWERLNAQVPIQLHAEVARKIRHALAPTDNVEWFAHLRDAGDCKWALHGVPNPFDLFPSNVAALDFLVKTIPDRKSVVILDLPCGIANMIVYLRRMGFIHSFGYDNFSQLAESSTRSFLRSWEMEDALVDSSGLERLNPTVLIFVGIHWRMCAEVLEPVIARSRPTFVLADCFAECPQELPGYRRLGEYRRLLRVFERTE
jgi:hypothetical protein